jgi:hypothetical protein
LPPPPITTIEIADTKTLISDIERYVDYVEVFYRGRRRIERRVRLQNTFASAYQTWMDSNLPLVEAVATLPIAMLGPDGALQLLAAPGLNRELQTIFRLEPRLVANLPKGPVPLEVAKASYQWLNDNMFVDVAFKNKVTGPAKTVALMLEGIERHLLKERPGALVTGDQAETGKTTLINMTVAAIIGSPAPAMAYGKDDEELRKMVLAACLYSPTFIAFDNIKRGTAIDSPEVARMMTAIQVQDRVLGESRIEAPLATTVPIFTGIRVTAKGEMGTRIFTIEIESPGLRPADRNFKHEQPVEWVIDNRLTILVHLYNILMVERTAPPRLKTRFKRWYEMVGYPIELVSGIDCATDMFGGGEDEEEEARATILEHLIKTFPLIPSEIPTNLVLLALLPLRWQPCC